MIWYIAAGSVLGGVSRYLLGGLIQRLLDTTFPAGTLVINVTGSFLLGAFLRYGVDTPTMGPEVRALLTIGFCGGFTTFSTFAWETVRLAETRGQLFALANIAASTLLSLAAVLAGAALAKHLA